MKRSELFDLYNKLQGLKHLSGNKAFSYALIKNIKGIESEINKLNDIIKPTKNFLQFEEARIDVCKSHTIKDENDEPIQSGEEYQIDDMEAFNLALEPLKEKYKTELTERQQQIDEYNSMLDIEIEFDFIKIGPDELPDAITPNELEDIYLILK
jgi:hypothetical protein